MATNPKIDWSPLVSPEVNRAFLAATLDLQFGDESLHDYSPPIVHIRAATDPGSAGNFAVMVSEKPYTDREIADRLTFRRGGRFVIAVTHPEYGWRVGIGRTRTRIGVVDVEGAPHPAIAVALPRVEAFGFIALLTVSAIGNAEFDRLPTRSLAVTGGLTHGATADTFTADEVRGLGLPMVEPGSPEGRVY